jgi:hypothetical protein
MNLEQSHERHLRAMELVDQAMHGRRIGDDSLIQKSLREAFLLEKEAATLVAGQLDLEPTRSVLHRSAASLAIQIGELREGERLLGAALAGFPPEEIAEELRDLMEQIYVKRGRKGTQSAA